MDGGSGMEPDGVQSGLGAICSHCPIASVINHFVMPVSQSNLHIPVSQWETLLGFHSQTDAHYGSPSVFKSPVSALYRLLRGTSAPASC